MKTKRCGSAAGQRACVHELPAQRRPKTRAITAQQMRATGKARDGVVVHAITKTNEKTNCPYQKLSY